MKPRKDSFWGIHSDFHASPEMGTVGKTLREEEIREICRLLRPDYWQVDCKGHPGWASYPTALGNAMPSFACDPLATWRRVTREEGVSLFLHYSGVIDKKYCTEHPEETVEGPWANGKSTRCNGSYVDELLIPQLSEAAERYQIDGVWLDGDCWGCRVDYHPETVAAFEKEYGVSLQGNPPLQEEDPYFHEYREYNRELFRRYLRHYVDTLHQKHPHLQICSNWMFSDHAPEAVTANVDFLSGDLNPWNAFNWARYAGRAMAQQKMPWDLMAWTHRSATEGHLDFLPVHPSQLIQEASAVISLGGGFQQVIGQLTDGSPDVDFLRQLKPLADFMREREAYCFRGTPIPQAAMLLSTYDRHREQDKVLFTRGDCNGKLGLCALLCDCGQSLEIVSEHTLRGNAASYPLLIVPELLHGLAEETVAELLDYAQKGGNLLLVGNRTLTLFAEQGAPFTVKPVEDEVLRFQRICQSNDAADQRYFTLNNKEYGAVFRPLEILAEGEVVASTCYTFQTERHPYAMIIPFGRGKVAAIGSDLGTHYTEEAQYLHRSLMKAVTEKLYTPMARVEKATGTLELVCLQKEERLLLQLVNANGNHASMQCATEDFIPPVLDVTLSVALPCAPKELRLQPEGRPLPFTYRDGRAYVEVPRVDYHSVIEIIKK